MPSNQSSISILCYRYLYCFYWVEIILLPEFTYFILRDKLCHVAFTGPMFAGSRYCQFIHWQHNHVCHYSFNVSKILDFEKSLTVNEYCLQKQCNTILLPKCTYFILRDKLCHVAFTGTMLEGGRYHQFIHWWCNY